ncbi:MAG: M18 family aminopeptidase [Porticoccaceae bacterium]
MSLPVPPEQSSVFNKELLAFIESSPTPFHAVETMVKRLKGQGFVRLGEAESWNLRTGDRYFVTRNGSSIIAFVKGRECAKNTGLRLVGAHTDSPCLMVKPRPELSGNGYFRLGVEVYGGALLNPWFDRDLSIAGRIVYRTLGGELGQKLVDFKDPIAVIPSLAIHLDRTANESRTVNPQTDIQPMLFVDDSGRGKDFNQLLGERFLKETGAEVFDYELYFYDTQKPAVIGLHNDFIASARLDNLLSCYVGAESIAAADGSQTAILVCNDHEEVGSASACGAQGTLLKSVLQRLIPDADERFQVISRSLMVSTDNAHGVHPNYPSKHDDNHQPLLNAGPVIKVNARQRYATNSLTAALFRQMAEEVGVKLQMFVARNDMPCGSTIGPLTAAEVGVPTLDVGVPTFAMHSIRELAGVHDGLALKNVLSHFFNKPEAPLVKDSD